MEPQTSAFEQMVLLSPRDLRLDTPRNRWDVVRVIDPNPVWRYGSSPDPSSVRPYVASDGSRHFLRGTTHMSPDGDGGKVLVSVVDTDSGVSWGVAVDPARLRPMSVLDNWKEGFTDS